MTDTQETIADIIAEIRALSNPISDGIIAINGRSIADRLEAAHKRECVDVAKLREACEALMYEIGGYSTDGLEVVWCGISGETIKKARAALATISNQNT